MKEYIHVSPKDVCKAETDLVSLIRSLYEGTAFARSRDRDLTAFETLKGGIIVVKYNPAPSFFAIWSSAISPEQFAPELEKLREKYK